MKTDIVDQQHECKSIEKENDRRIKEGELSTSVRKDSEGWFLKVGHEFLQVAFCPCCGAKLK